ncbi:MAG TPA: hypothetical protein VGF38_10110 [Ktedonobacterales bacterium]
MLWRSRSARAEVESIPVLNDPARLFEEVVDPCPRYVFGLHLLFPRGGDCGT